MLRILRISVVVTPENIFDHMDISHIPAYIATRKRLATKMGIFFVTRCKATKIIAVLQLNDEVG